MAVLADTGATVIVTLNGLRLLRCGRVILRDHSGLRLRLDPAAIALSASVP